MTTYRHRDPACDAYDASPLRPFLDHWVQQSGMLSALPDAPVVPDRTRRGAKALARLVRRPTRRQPAVARSARAAATHPRAIAGRGC